MGIPYPLGVNTGILSQALMVYSNIAFTNDCNEIDLSKGALLRIGGRMGHHICIAQVDIWKEYWCVIVMKMNEWVTI